MCSGQGDGRVMFTIADEMHCSTTIIWVKDQFTLGRGTIIGLSLYGLDGQKMVLLLQKIEHWMYGK